MHEEPEIIKELRNREKIHTNKEGFKGTGYNNDKGDSLRKIFTLFIILLIICGVLFFVITAIFQGADDRILKLKNRFAGSWKITNENEHYLYYYKYENYEYWTFYENNSLKISKYINYPSQVNKPNLLFGFDNDNQSLTVLDVQPSYYELTELSWINYKIGYNGNLYITYDSSDEREYDFFFDDNDTKIELTSSTYYSQIYVLNKVDKIIASFNSNWDNINISIINNEKINNKNIRLNDNQQYYDGLACPDEWGNISIEDTLFFDIEDSEFYVFMKYNNSDESIGAWYFTNKAIDDALIGYWSFDTIFDDIVIDGSKNQNYGKNYGAQVEMGIIGNALNFSNYGDYIDIENIEDFVFSDESFSVSLWVKIFSNTNNYNQFFVLGDSNDNRPVFLVGKCRKGAHNGSIYTKIEDSWSSGKSVISLKNGSELPKDTWMLLTSVVDYSKSKHYLYINDKLQDSKDVNNFDMNNAFSLKLNIGRMPWGGGVIGHEYHEGLIDEVRVYNKALTYGEILSYYNSVIS